jgi:hypothetical protein
MSRGSLAKKLNYNTFWKPRMKKTNFFSKLFFVGRNDQEFFALLSFHELLIRENEIKQKIFKKVLTNQFGKSMIYKIIPKDKIMVYRVVPEKARYKVVIAIEVRENKKY